MSQTRPPLSQAERKDAALIWDYHQMHHELRPCSVGICLGGPDPGTADFASELYLRGMFPRMVFTGANSSDTTTWFPRGEAVHNGERAIELGVPADAVLIEPEATNTGQNISLSRKVLDESGASVGSVMLICMPYMERRAYATCRKAWPHVDITCASEPMDFDGYADRIGDPPLALDMILGDLQRIMIYPARGFAIRQAVPADVLDAYERLLAAGFTSRLAEQ